MLKRWNRNLTVHAPDAGHCSACVREISILFLLLPTVNSFVLPCGKGPLRLGNLILAKKPTGIVVAILSPYFILLNFSIYFFNSMASSSSIFTYLLFFKSRMTYLRLVSVSYCYMASTIFLFNSALFADFM